MSEPSKIVEESFRREVTDSMERHVSLLDLPDELLLEVMSLLDAGDAMKVCRVNRRLRGLRHDFVRMRLLRRYDKEALHKLGCCTTEDPEENENEEGVCVCLQTYLQAFPWQLGDRAKVVKLAQEGSCPDSLVLLGRLLLVTVTETEAEENQARCQAVDRFTLMPVKVILERFRMGQKGYFGLVSRVKTSGKLALKEGYNLLERIHSLDSSTLTAEESLSINDVADIVNRYRYGRSFWINRVQLNDNGLLGIVVSAQDDSDDGFDDYAYEEYGYKPPTDSVVLLMLFDVISMLCVGHTKLPFETLSSMDSYMVDFSMDAKHVIIAYMLGGPFDVPCHLNILMLDISSVVGQEGNLHERGLFGRGRSPSVTRYVTLCPSLDYEDSECLRLGNIRVKGDKLYLAMRSQCLEGRHEVSKIPGASGPPTDHSFLLTVKLGRLADGYDAYPAGGFHLEHVEPHRVTEGELKARLSVEEWIGYFWHGDSFYLGARRMNEEGRCRGDIVLFINNDPGVGDWTELLRFEDENFTYLKLDWFGLIAGSEEGLTSYRLLPAEKEVEEREVAAAGE